MIITQVLGRLDSFDVGSRAIDRVPLLREDMRKGHQRLTCESGFELAVSLGHGEELAAGDVLFADEERVVTVDALPEDALVIYPESQFEWAFTGYNLGNMHQAAYIQPDCFVTPYDYIIEEMLKKIGVHYHREQVKIEGTRANLTTHHHAGGAPHRHEEGSSHHHHEDGSSHHHH